MTSRSHLRKAATGLPETDVPGADTYSIRGRVFALATNVDEVELRLGPQDAVTFRHKHPGCTGTGGAVRLPLPDLNGQELNHWVRRAWHAQAPDALAAARTAAENARAGEVGDLPKALGNVATRALAAAGLTTIKLATDLTDAELLTIHGVGPRAVRELRAQLRKATDDPKGT